MTEPRTLDNDPLYALKRALAKDQLFLQFMHDYLEKSEMPPPKKLTLEMIEIQLSTIETVNALLELEAKRRNVPADPELNQKESLHESAEKRLRRILTEP